MKPASLHSRLGETGFALIVATKAYDRLAAFLSVDEAARLEAFIAANPESGDLIPGTGGIRKLRWAASGRGKRGGARIIYYYHSPAMILFLLAAYTKATKIDLTSDEKKQFRKLTEHLKNQYT